MVHYTVRHTVLKLLYYAEEILCCKPHSSEMRLHHTDMTLMSWCSVKDCWHLLPSAYFLRVSLCHFVSFSSCCDGALLSLAVKLQAVIPAYDNSSVNNERHEFQVVAFKPSERRTDHVEKPSGCGADTQRCNSESGSNVQNHKTEWEELKIPK